MLLVRIGVAGRCERGAQRGHRGGRVQQVGGERRVGWRCGTGIAATAATARRGRHRARVFCFLFCEGKASKEKPADLR
jgi:hypothetical protein